MDIIIQFAECFRWGAIVLSPEKFELMEEESYNTDTYGFLQGLKAERGFTCGGKKVLLLGAGGAARGVLQALDQERVAECVIANRTRSRAEALVTTGQHMGIDCQVIGMTWEELSLAAVTADLIVNCTTIGMSHTKNEGDSPLQPQQIPPSALVYDLVYNPVETPLIRAAARAGGPPTRRSSARAARAASARARAGGSGAPWSRTRWRPRGRRR